LAWNHISPRLSHIPKGKQPLWFKTLEDIVIENQAQRTLYTNCEQQGFNPFAYNTYNIPKKSKPWLLTFNDDNEVIIGKIRKKLTKTNEISITHWQTDIDINYMECYPLPNVHCRPCPGCHLNSHRVKSACTINTSSITSIQFLG